VHTHPRARARTDSYKLQYCYYYDFHYMRQTQVFIIVSSSSFVFPIQHLCRRRHRALEAFSSKNGTPRSARDYNIIIKYNHRIFAYLILYFIIVPAHNVMFFSKRFTVNYVLKIKQSTEFFSEKIKFSSQQYFISIVYIGTFSLVL